MKFMVR